MICICLFFVSLAVISSFIKSALKHDHPVSTLVAISTFSLLWVSFAGVFYYKATKLKQTTLRQAAIFVLTPIVLSPIIAVTYVAIVLFPIYSLVNQNGFTN